MRIRSSRLKPQVSRLRTGFTLVEILLVLTILVVIGALVWPALQGPFDSLRLRQAGEVVRVAWSEARLEAMSTGVMHVFRYEPEGDRYLVEPWAGLDSSLESNDPLATVEPPPAGVNPLALEGGIGEKLPEGVWFAGGASAIDARAQQAAAGQEPGAADGLYGTPILFYPDGTTSEAELVLANEHNRLITLRLRSITGSSRASSLWKQE
jgi:prepilin-type N-terminal cleavage/methylation domain-containing protein